MKVALSTYLLLTLGVGVYAFWTPAGGPDDLFPGVAFFMITLPSSLLLLWMATGNHDPSVVALAVPFLNTALIWGLWGVLRRLRPRPRA